MKSELMRLSALGGISGFEYTIADEITALLRDYCDEVSVDSMGNVIGVFKCHKKDAKKVMIEAHTDGIGLMVSGIDDDGFISFVPIGGIDAGILPSCDVTVCGKKNLFGVIGAKPPHLLGNDAQKNKYSIEDLSVDVGLSADEVKKNVRIGDMITFSSGAKKLSHKIFAGKYFDDRAGLISLLICLRKLKNSLLDFDVVLLASTSEEVGLRGAKTGAYAISPDCAIVVDVCHGDTPDSGSESIFPLGCGAVISKGPNIHPYLSALAEAVAKKEKIAATVDVDGGDTGTDAWAVQVTKSGIPTLLLSIPLRYMHTTVETASFDDIEAVGALLCGILKNLNPEELSCFYQS